MNKRLPQAGGGNKAKVDSSYVHLATVDSLRTFRTGINELITWACSNYPPRLKNGIILVLHARAFYPATINLFRFVDYRLIILLILSAGQFSTDIQTHYANQEIPRSDYKDRLHCGLG